MFQYHKFPLLFYCQEGVLGLSFYVTVIVVVVVVVAAVLYCCGTNFVYAVDVVDLWYSKTDIHNYSNG